MKRILWLCALAVVVTGCVRKETSGTFYLEPGGAVTWMVLEKDIRSDAEDAKERATEEEEFMAPRWSGDHDIAVTMADLGGEGIETRVLRETRPYMVATEARFDSFDGMLQAFFDLTEAPVYAQIRRTEGRARLMISCDLERLEEATQDEQEEGEVDPLAVLADEYRVVLTEGKFVEARGFELEDEGTLAVLVEQTEEEIEAIEEVDESGAVVVYSLTWTVPDES